MAKNWTTDGAITLEDRISIEAESLPVEIKGAFASLKINEYWPNVKVIGPKWEMWPNEDIVKTTLTLIDLEIFNNTNDDFYLDSGDEPLRIIDSNGYSYKLLNANNIPCPQKYSYLYDTNVGGFITPESRSRGIVAFPKISENSLISKILLKSGCELYKQKRKKELGGFSVTRVANQWLEIKMIGNLKSKNKIPK